MSKAPETKLNELHGQLAETLTKMVQVREVEKVDKEGEVVIETVEPSPAALAVAAKFLKDNSIFSTPEGDSKLKSLEEAVADRRQRLGIVKADLKDALGSLGKELLQ